MHPIVSPRNILLELCRTGGHVRQALISRLFEHRLESQSRAVRGEQFAVELNRCDVITIDDHHVKPVSPTRGGNRIDDGIIGPSPQQCGHAASSQASRASATSSVPTSALTWAPV